MFEFSGCRCSVVRDATVIKTVCVETQKQGRAGEMPPESKSLWTQ